MSTVNKHARSGSPESPKGSDQSMPSAILSDTSRHLLTIDAGVQRVSLRNPNKNQGVDVKPPPLGEPQREWIR